jgi:pSer/pThr/pTyr-binding forkhead associated (FHA) protein
MECGAEMEIPLTSVTTLVKCKCGTVYEYNPTVELLPYLLLEENKRSLEHPLTTSINIGREDNTDYLTLTCQHDESVKQKFYIRNRYISRNHGKITMEEEFALSKKGSSKIVAKKKCIIEDCGSTNGTSVNNRLLKPREPKELKHDDHITLAPNSNCPLTIVFKER